MIGVAAAYTFIQSITQWNNVQTIPDAAGEVDIKEKSTSVLTMTPGGTNDAVREDSIRARRKSRAAVATTSELLRPVEEDKKGRLFLLQLPPRPTKSFGDTASITSASQSPVGSHPFVLLDSDFLLHRALRGWPDEHVYRWEQLWTYEYTCGRGWMQPSIVPVASTTETSTCISIDHVYD